MTGHLLHARQTSHISIVLGKAIVHDVKRHRIPATT
jgi:hypothetical protein